MTRQTRSLKCESVSVCMCVFVCERSESVLFGAEDKLENGKKCEVVEKNCLQPNCMVGNNRRLSDSSIFFDPIMLLECSADSVNHMFKCRRLNCCYPMVTLKSVETKKRRKR